MLKALLTRRRFLSGLPAFLGAAVSRRALANNGRPDAGIDRAALDALLDTLIPADEDPGALEAGVRGQILDRLAGDPVASERYRRLLDWIHRRSIERYGGPFHRLHPERRHVLLIDLSRSGDKASTRPRIDLQIARDHAFRAFYSSPAAGPVIGYHPPIQGGYPGYDTPPAPPA